MDIQTFLLFGVPAVVIVLTFLGFTLNGPRLLARLWARIQARRRELEEWKQLVQNSMDLAQRQMGLLEWLMKRQTALEAELKRLREEPAYAEFAERFEKLEHTVAVLNLAAIKGMFSAMEEAERELTPQEPAEEPVRLSAPDYRHNSN